MAGRPQPARHREAVAAAAVGNIVVQARATGALPDSREAVREGIAKSAWLRRYDAR
jgi:hypothetical protein